MTTAYVIHCSFYFFVLAAAYLLAMLVYAAICALSTVSSFWRGTMSTGERLICDLSGGLAISGTCLGGILPYEALGWLWWLVLLYGMSTVVEAAIRLFLEHKKRQREKKELLRRQAQALLAPPPVLFIQLLILTGKFPEKLREEKP